MRRKAETPAEGTFKHGFAFVCENDLKLQLIVTGRNLDGSASYLFIAAICQIATKTRRYDTETVALFNGKCCVSESGVTKRSKAC